MTIDGHDLQKYSTSDKFDWVDLSTNFNYWTTEATSLKIGDVDLPRPSLKK